MPLNSPQPSLSSRFQYQESFAMISKDWRANLHAHLGGIVKDSRVCLWPLEASKIMFIFSSVCVPLIDWTTFFGTSKQTRRPGFMTS